MKKFVMNFKKMFHIMSVIKRASKPYFILVFVRNIIASVLPFVEIIFVNKIINGLLSNSGEDVILNYVYWMILINLIIGIMLQIIDFYQGFNSLKLSYNIDNLVAMKTFELDYAQIENNEVMKLIKRAKEGSNSSGGIERYASYIVGNIINSVLTIIYATILLTGLFSTDINNQTSTISKIINHPLSGVMILIVLFLSSIINTIVMNKDNKKSYKAMMGNIDGNRKFGYFYNVCSNYKHGKDIRLYGMQGMLIEAMSSEKNSVDNVWRDYANYNIKCQTVIIFLSKFLAFSAYLYVGLKAIYGFISIGEVVAYSSAITLFASKISSFISTYSEMSLRNNYLDNYFEFLNLKPHNSFGNEEINEDEEIEVEFKNLSFAYPNQTELILKDINLKIKKGQKIAIVGSNGAGKTTLIKLLCRLYEPTSGDILINNKPISTYTQDACYKLFSIVFQDFKLFSYSVKDNVASGPDGDEELIWNCLEKAGIKERVITMPDKLETIIYQRNRKNGVEISGGEAQKLAIARALYKDAPIVILDEPTSALDPKSEAEIYEKFKGLVENKTSIFISHRMSSCKFCDEIVVIDKGEIAETGSHQQLLTKGGIYNKMWNAQAQYYQ